MLRAYILHYLTVKKLLILSRQGRVRLYTDPILPTKLYCWPLPQKWVNLKLVYNRLYVTVLEQVLQMMFEKVTNPYITDLPLRLQLNKCFPGFQSHCLVLLTVQV